MIIHALLVATSLAAPIEAPVAAADTFEITLMNQQMPGTTAGIIRIEADALDFIQWNLVVLRKSTATVAAFQSHQVQLVVNRSEPGARTFSVIPQNGSGIEIHADRMVPQQNNIILFYTGDEVVGLASQNGAQMVIDNGARIDGDGPKGRPVHSDSNRD